MIDVNDIKIEYKEKGVIEDSISYENYEYLKYNGEIQGINVTIVENKYISYEENINLLKNILENLEQYKQLCHDRIKSWFGQDGKYILKEIHCGYILCNGEIDFGRVFGFTLVKANEEEWSYTIKFNKHEKIGWPIGAEIWSEKRIEQAILKNSLITKENYLEESEEYIEKAMKRKETEYKIRKSFFESIVRQKGAYEEYYNNDYYTNEEILIGSRYYGTKVLDYYFYELLCGNNTGNIIEDIYSNYKIKFTIEDSFYPLGIEFFVG